MKSLSYAFTFHYFGLYHTASRASTKLSQPKVNAKTFVPGFSNSSRNKYCPRLVPKLIRSYSLSVSSLTTPSSTSAPPKKRSAIISKLYHDLKKPNSRCHRFFITPYYLGTFVYVHSRIIADALVHQLSCQSYITIFAKINICTKLRSVFM